MELSQLVTRVGCKMAQPQQSGWLQTFSAANNIGPDKQVQVFLHIVGSRNYALIKSLTAPTLPQEKSYEDLKAALLAHFRPKSLLIAE